MNRYELNSEQRTGSSQDLGELVSGQDVTAVRINFEGGFKVFHLVVGKGDTSVLPCYASSSLRLISFGDTGDTVA